MKSKFLAIPVIIFLCIGAGRPFEKKLPVVFIEATDKEKTQKALM